MTFSRKGRGGNALEGIPSNQTEERNQMKMINTHISVKKVTYPLEGIPSNQMEARNQMNMVSSSVQKVTFFKERERRGSI